MRLERTDSFRPRSRLLVVDDDPLFAKLALAALSAEGHKILHAATGDEALAEMDMLAPDLVILDCGLGGISELALMEEINRREKDVSIVVLSARRGPIHEQVMRSFGAHHVLSKPISAAEIQNAINQILSQKKIDVL